MLLYEYEAREILARYGVPVEEAGVASTPEEAAELAREIPSPYMVKAQVLTTGRGKAGGVIPADTSEDVFRAAEKLLSSKIHGLSVRRVMVSHRVNVKRELYVSISIDRSSRAPIVLASTIGGVDVEEVARSNPQAILKVPIDPLAGLKPYMVRLITNHLGLTGTLAGEARKLLSSLYRVFEDYDCLLVEVNPLALTPEGLVAIDRRIVVDDSAAATNDRVRKLWEERLSELGESEKEARKWGFSYVALDGDIGVVGNGAGLTMSTLDLVISHGGRPACFLDIGGGASSERVKAAVSMLLRNPRVKVILLNILAGITRCDEVAKGLIDALREVGVEKPVVIRLSGTLEEEGRRLLREAGIPFFSSAEEAAKRSVEVAKSGRAGG